MDAVKGHLSIAHLVPFDLITLTIGTGYRDEASQSILFPQSEEQSFTPIQNNK
jgi:hypothetical protein